MFCSNCGHEIDDNAIICVHCGVPTANMQRQQQNAVQSKPVNGLGIAGFAVGLIGFVGGNLLLNFPGLVALILSIVGMVQKKNCGTGNGLAIAGLIINIFSLVFWTIIWIAAFVSLANGNVPTY